MELVESAETGGEREVLLASLHNQRAVIQWKLRGLSPEQAGTMVTGHSVTNLMGIVKHLALVERWWFVSMFRGDEFDHPYDFEADPDAEFHPHPSDTVESVIADYDDAIATADGIIGGADLDDIAARPRKKNGRPITLRWIIMHMIEETARHAGQADIVRELVDGRLGYLPDDD